MTGIRLEGFCSASFRYILRNKRVRPTLYVNIAYNKWMMNQRLSRNFRKVYAHNVSLHFV